MKYWVFQNNQVCGPYEPEDLGRMPGYGAESLVCPEGRKGTTMGDWQRAGMLPELSASLAKSAQPAGAEKVPAKSGGGGGGLPPEPTLKDLAALGSLQEKLAMLETSVSRLQEGITSKETELLSLHREVELRKDSEDKLQANIRELEERLAAVAQLRATIDNALAAEKSVESEVKGVETTVQNVESSVREVKTSVDGVNKTVTELEGALEQQRQTIARLTDQLDQLKTAQKEAPAPAPAPAPEPEPVRSDFGTATPLAAEPARLDGGPAVQSAWVPPTDTGAMSLTPPPANQSAAALGGDLAGAPAASLFPGSETFPPGYSAPAAKAPIADVIAAPQPKSGNKVLLTVLIAGGAAAAGFLAIQFGLLPGQSAPETATVATTPETPAAPAMPAAAPATPAPVPATDIVPQAPSPEAVAEDLKRQAIALVQSWPTGDKASTLGERLQSQHPQAAGQNLSPWMAEKLKDDSFQVNFYGAKSESGKTAVVEFHADLTQKAVTPLNVAARELVEPPAPPAPQPLTRKVRVKAKKAASLQAPAEEDEPAAAPRKKSKRPAKARKPIKKVAPAPAPAPGKPDEIDNLLMPGHTASEKTAPVLNEDLPGMTPAAKNPAKVRKTRVQPRRAAAPPPEKPNLDELLPGMSGKAGMPTETAEPAAAPQPTPARQDEPAAKSEAPARPAAKAADDAALFDSLLD